MLDYMGLAKMAKGPDLGPKEVPVHEGGEGPTLAQRIALIGLCTEAKTNKNGGRSTHGGKYFDEYRDTEATTSVL